METLGEALPREMARVRDEIMPRYIEIGPSAAVAAAAAAYLNEGPPMP